MGLLKPAENKTAFIKLGLLGFEGSGKTYTAVDFALGLMKLTGGKKVAFFDSEKGSDFHIARFKKAGIAFDVVRSKSFKDCVETIREAEREKYGFLIIDSITHVWRELCESYLKRAKHKHLTMKDWGVLKTEWSQFTDLYVNSKLHVAMLGRAGYQYETEEDEDGKRETVKAGTKMKVETETGFEPDLLIEMYRVPKAQTGDKPDKKARGFGHRALILKDRTDTITGRMFDEPKFKDFEPVIKFLNLGGEHEGFTGRSSEDLFESPDSSYYERRRLKDIELEELQATLVKGGLDGTAAETKKKRIAMLEEVFGRSAKTHIESLELQDLRMRHKVLRQKLGITDPPAEGQTAPASEAAPIKDEMDAVPF